MTSNPDSITAPLAYTIDDGEQHTRDLRHGAGGGVDSGDDNIVMISKEVRNARKLRPPASLDVNGFALVTHRTSLSHSDFRAVPFAKKADYYGEIEALVAGVTGAAQVKAFHHMLRLADPQAIKTEHTQGPAGAAHVDYSTHSSLNMYVNMCPKEIYGRGSYAVINAWRNIKTDPAQLRDPSCAIRDHHLAMCDCRSVAAPDDFVRHFVIQRDGKKIEAFRMCPTHAQTAHKWFYYPSMMGDEVLLFVQYHSDTTRSARYTFHTSMKDPTAPTSGCAFRESIEMRCIAFFPDDPRQTIPQQIFAGSHAVRAGVTKILTMVNYLSSWDESGRTWLASTIFSAPSVQEGQRKVLAKLVEDHVRRGDTTTFDSDTFNEIIQKLVEGGEFLRIVEKELKPDTETQQVQLAMRSIVNSVKPDVVAKHWDTVGKSWLSTTVKAKGLGGAPIEIAKGLVAHSAKEGTNGIARGASAAFQTQVINAVVGNNDFHKHLSAFV